VCPVVSPSAYSRSGSSQTRIKWSRAPNTVMARFQRAEKHWVEAQKRYERAYGGRQTSELRESLRAAVIASDLGPLKAA
jgi:hypothetical protein